MKTSFDFLCIDEHDSPNLTELNGKTRAEIKELKNKRYFGICGVNIPGAIYPDVNVSGRKIQERILGQEVFQPFHYTEILNNSGNWAFLGKFKSKRISLIMQLNNFIIKEKFKIIASFVSKDQLALNYGIFPSGKLERINKIKPNISCQTTPKNINLYDIALKFILSEYYKYLTSKKKRGVIIAEARGEREDSDLLNSFYRFQKFGAGSLSGKELRDKIVDLLIIRKKQNHLGLQLADLITYPLYDFFIPEHNIRDDHFIKKSSFEKKIISIKILPN